MNYRPQAFFLLITSTGATLFVSIIIARAQTLTLQENTPSPIPSPFSKPTPILDATLTALETKVDGLDEQLNNPPKDIWDKIDAISGLISGVLIAVIGRIATYIYREREKASQEAQRKRENAINEVQTI